MRDIKFRGRDFKGKWWFGDLRHVKTRGGGERVRIVANEQGKRISVNIEQSTLGEFTDSYCDGREIYEGDLIRFKSIFTKNIEVIGIVEFFDSCFTVNIEHAGFTTTRIILSDIRGSETEIVGNIHDNYLCKYGGFYNLLNENKP